MAQVFDGGWSLGTTAERDLEVESKFDVTVAKAQATGVRIAGFFRGLLGSHQPHQTSVCYGKPTVPMLIRDR